MALKNAQWYQTLGLFLLYSCKTSLTKPKLLPSKSYQKNFVQVISELITKVLNKLSPWSLHVRIIYLCIHVEVAIRIKYELVILPVLSPCKFPKCKHNKISAASTYSSSRLLEGHNRNTVFQTTGWFLALLSVRTLQTKSLCLCSHWQIKQRKKIQLDLEQILLFHFYAFLKSSLFSI